MLSFLLVVASAVVIALAAYAAWLGWRLYVQKHERERHNAAVFAETEADLARSIAVLADSLLTGELNLSEGAIRLKVLLDHWYAPASGQDDYPGIYRLYLLTSTMPRGTARDIRPHDEIRRLDNERELFEQQEHEDILAEAVRLQQCFGVPEGRTRTAQAEPG